MRGEASCSHVTIGAHQSVRGRRRIAYRETCSDSARAFAEVAREWLHRQPHAAASIFSLLLEVFGVNGV